MSLIFQKREAIDYICNFYRHQLYDKLTKTYLLTTDDGNFLFLNDSAFRQLKRGRIEDETLYNALHQKGIIITDKNFNQIVEKTKQRYSFLQNGTSLHIVIPTHRCNLSCVYCFASAPSLTDSKEKNDMDENIARKITKFIMKSPSNAITMEFQGGEPLVKFDMIQLMVKYAKELNLKHKKDLRFALVSNLTLMTEDKANWLIENGVTICTSFDGPKQVHDKNRMILAKNSTGIGTYEKVTFWIKKINEIYNQKNMSLKVNALMTITRNSLAYHKEIIDEYIKLNINVVNIRPLTQIGRAIEQNQPTIYYSMQEFNEFYEKSLKYIQNLIQNGTIIEERIVELYKQKILVNKPGYHTDYESPCGALTGQMTYFNDGSIYTCNESLGREEFKVGDVFNTNWQNLFKKKEVAKAILNSMLEQNVKCDRCPYKPYCGTCMVENFYKEGKFNFYPDKSKKHDETLYHSKKIFDEILRHVRKQ